jgi:hypothetical protein
MAKDTQLRGLAEAALEFGKARELGQHEHRIPQRDGFFVTGNAGNHRAKKGHPIGGRKRDDWGAHVRTGATEGELGLRVEFGIPPRVIRASPRPRATRACSLRQCGPQCPASDSSPSLWLIPVGAAIAFVEGHGFPTQLGPYIGGDPQHAQARRMAALMVGSAVASFSLLRRRSEINRQSTMYRSGLPLW